MIGIATSFALAVMGVVAGDLPSESPEDLAARYMPKLISMTERAVQQCDSLSKEPNCYLENRVPGEAGMPTFHNDPRKAVSLPQQLLGDSPEILQLRASCYPPIDHKGPFWHCDAQSIQKTQIARLCSPFMVVTPEPADWREKGYETVAIPENPECKIPWVRMTVIRKSPDGNELVLEAHVLPKKWLHEHPETIDKIERSSIRPSPDEPVGVERREGTQSLDDGSDLDKEQVRKHKGGILTHQTPAVDGEIEPHRISKAVFSRATQLKACYEAALARNLPRKSLVQIHWKVTTKGRATNVEIEEDNVGDPRLLQCLRHEIAQTSFPAEKGGPTDVVFHFIYDVGGDP